MFSIMRTLRAAFLALIFTMACMGDRALASSGCTAINAGTWIMSVTAGTISRNDNFSNGDKLHFAILLGDPEFNNYIFGGSLVAGGHSGQSSVDFTATSGAGSLTLTSNQPVGGISARTISVASASCVAAQTSTTTTLSALPNPSKVGQTVTLSAAVIGSSPTGTVIFSDGGGPLGSAALSGGVATLTTTSLAVGSHALTATYQGDSGNLASTSDSVMQTVTPVASSVALASSANPSTGGQVVIFTATVSGVFPTGSVTFFDGASPISSANLSGGVATLATSALSVGEHAISAHYNGDASNLSGTSSVLYQSVQLPPDSVKLKTLQQAGTLIVSQISGDAISSALSDAVGDGLGGALEAASFEGKSVTLRFAPLNYAGASLGQDNLSGGSLDTRDSLLDTASQGVPARQPWYVWIQIRQSALTGVDAGGLRGSQTNLVGGVTSRVSSNIIVGLLGGYEHFDFKAKALAGRVNGDGWTVGGYVGWRLSADLKLDAGFAHTRVSYNASAGTAAGFFSGNRWLASGGLTGTVAWGGFNVEPSLRVYGLSEQEDGYTDSLGTVQAPRGFDDGRVRGGTRLLYPLRLSALTTAEPYFGIYGDYHFNGANALSSDPSFAYSMQGWSASLVSGVRIQLEPMHIDFEADYGGLGATTSLWTLRLHAGVSM